MKTEREFYPALEIIRGLCATEVFIWHVFNFIDGKLLAQYGLTTVAYVLHELSESAILIFFGISGFVVSNSFAFYRSRVGDLRAIPHFLAARWLRIWALTSIVSLTAFALAVYWRTQVPDIAFGSRYTDGAALLYSVLGYSAHWNPPGWTLPYEMFAYSLTPFVILLLTVRDVRVILPALTGLAIALWFHLDFMGMGYKPAFVMLACFAGGGLVHAARARLAPLSGWVLFLFGLVPLSALSLLDEGGYDWWAPKAAAVIAIIAGSFALPVHLTHLTRPLMTLGAMSYSVYLWHWPIMWFGNIWYYRHQFPTSDPKVYATTLDGMIFLVFYLVPLVFALSYASYFLIERHSKFSSIQRRFGTWRKTRQPA